MAYNAKYGSLEQLQQLCQANPRVKPIFDLPVIHNIESTIHHQLAKIDPVWVKMTLDELMKQIDKHKAELAQSAEQRVVNASELERLESVRQQYLDEIRRDTGVLNNLKAQYPAPSESLDCVNSWLSEYHSHAAQVASYESQVKKLSETVNQYMLCERNIDDVGIKLDIAQQQLTRLKSENHAFNPDCWACAQQPWKLSIDQSEHEVKSLESQLTSLREDLQRQKANHVQALIDIEQANQWLSLVKSRQSLLAYWQRQLLLNQEQVRVTAAEKGLEQKRERLEQVEIQLQELDLKQKSVESVIQKLSEIMTDMTHYFNNRDNWEQQLTIAAQQRELHASYAQTSIAHNNLADYLKIVDDESKMAKYQEWNRIKLLHESKIATKKCEIEALKAQISRFENGLQVAQREALHNKRKHQFDLYQTWLKKTSSLRKKILTIRLDQTSLTIEQVQTYIQSRQSLEKWREIRDIKPLHQNKTMIKSQIAALRLSVNDLEKRLHQTNDLYDKSEQQRKLSASYATSIERLKDIRSAIDHIRNSFSGFHQWLYSQVVLPKLLGEVNRLMAVVTDTDKYQLVCTAEEEKGNTVLSWYVNDGSNRATIQKAGGFRAFMFGLLLRIAMSRLGTTSTSCRQIFIDEGFLAADSENIEKMPDFIKALLQIYDGIPMVSHYEPIRESATIKVNICKDNKSLSRIQYGSSTWTQRGDKKTDLKIKLKTPIDKAETPAPNPMKKLPQIKLKQIII